jgi:hypothetical protein
MPIEQASCKITAARINREMRFFRCSMLRADDVIE